MLVVDKGGIMVGNGEVLLVSLDYFSAFICYLITTSLAQRPMYKTDGFKSLQFIFKRTPLYICARFYFYL